MTNDDTLRPDLQRVEERLRGVELQLGRLIAQLQSEQRGMLRSLDQLRQVNESHTQILVGQNGHSLVTRIALLEDAEHTRKWSMRALWGAALAVVAKALHDLLRGGIR